MRWQRLFIGLTVLLMVLMVLAAKPLWADDCRNIGKTWTGTIHNDITSTFRAGAGGSCTGEAWDYSLHLEVGDDGTVHGRAVGTMASGPQCSFPVSYPTRPQARNKSGDVSGKFDGRQFELQITMTRVDGATIGVDSLVAPYGLEPKIVVPVTGNGTAQGEGVTTRTAGTVVGSGRHTVTLSRLAHGNIGFIYVNSPAGKIMIYQDHSTDSTVVLEAPNGARAVFNDVKEVNGQLWYQTRIPGVENWTGWIQGDVVSCTPPAPIRPGTPRHLIDSGLGNTHATPSMCLCDHG